MPTAPRLSPAELPAFQALVRELLDVGANLMLAMRRVMDREAPAPQADPLLLADTFHFLARGMRSAIHLENFLHHPQARYLKVGAVRGLLATIARDFEAVARHMPDDAVESMALWPELKQRITALLKPARLPIRPRPPRRTQH